MTRSSEDALDDAGWLDRLRRNFPSAGIVHTPVGWFAMVGKKKRWSALTAFGLEIQLDAEKIPDLPNILPARRLRVL